VSTNAPGGRPQLLNYWRLWLVNALLVSAGVLIFLASQYGTREFFGVACLMALLPFIPVIVLVGGAGSTIYVLTKVLIEKRSLRMPAALLALMGPGLVWFLLCLLLAGKSPARWLSYICDGAPPASASQVRVAGYSTFLGEAWLAVFNVPAQDFQTLVAREKLVPADDFEYRKMLEQSPIHKSRLMLSLPAASLPCFQRRFKPGEEHKRGSIFAVFDPATSTAVVCREYHD